MKRSKEVEVEFALRESRKDSLENKTKSHAIVKKEVRDRIKKYI